MKEFSGKLTGQLMELTTMVRGDLSNLNRKKINQLIIIDVHAETLSTRLFEIPCSTRESSA